MLSCIIWFSAPSFWMGGSLESRCVGCVYSADGAWWWAYVHETCGAKNTSINYLVASSWHFTLFHEEDPRSNNPHGGYSVSICLQQTWMNSKILSWDAHASPSLLTDFTSLCCLHHIMSYYFYTLLSTNIYTDNPWLILGFRGPVCKVITSFRNNLYMYTNRPLVQQYKVSMHQTYKQNNASYYTDENKNKGTRYINSLAHKHTLH